LYIVHWYNYARYTITRVIRIPAFVSVLTIATLMTSTSRLCDYHHECVFGAAIVVKNAYRLIETFKLPVWVVPGLLGKSYAIKEEHR
jgi:hypothetical protein